MNIDENSSQHVFISYVRENAEIIDRLVSELTKHGIKCWTDRNEITPGARWQNAIKDAIENGAFFIACFSVEYSQRKKTYMNKELNLAIEELKMRGPDKIWFIPIMVSKCEIPNFDIGGGETLLSLQWLDLTTDWISGINRLVSLIVGINSNINHEIYKILNSLDEIEKEVLKSLYQFFKNSPFTIADVRNRTFYSERLSRTLYNHMIRGLIDKSFDNTKKQWQYILPDTVVRYVENELKKV